MSLKIRTIKLSGVFIILFLIAANASARTEAPADVEKLNADSNLVIKGIPSAAFNKSLKVLGVLKNKTGIKFTDNSIAPLCDEQVWTPDEDSRPMIIFLKEKKGCFLVNFIMFEAKDIYYGYTLKDQPRYLSEYDVYKLIDKHEKLCTESKVHSGIPCSNASQVGVSKP